MAAFLDLLNLSTRTLEKFGSVEAPAAWNSAGGHRTGAGLPRDSSGFASASLGVSYRLAGVPNPSARSRHPPGWIHGQVPHIRSHGPG